MSAAQDVVGLDWAGGHPLVSGQTHCLLPPQLDHRRPRSLSFQAASVLARVGSDSVEDMAKVGRGYFWGRPTLGKKTLQALAILPGFSPERATARDAVAAVLAMAITDPDETQEIATDILIALRCSGYVVVARKTTPGRSQP